MQCPGCGQELASRRKWRRSRTWCSAACRRRLVRELRDLSLTVARCSDAIEMPAEIGARDELARRFIASMPAVRPVEQANVQPPGPKSDDTVPVYWEPNRPMRSDRRRLPPTGPDPLGDLRAAVRARQRKLMSTS